jgi:hypothetical protein
MLKESRGLHVSPLGNQVSLLDPETGKIAEDGT